MRGSAAFIKQIVATDTPAIAVEAAISVLKQSMVIMNMASADTPLHPRDTPNLADVKYNDEVDSERNFYWGLGTWGISKISLEDKVEEQSIRTGLSATERGGIYRAPEPD